ncbi:MBL fold metallo-hydrolase [Mucilaginibacter terrae]|uniref:MBL fold metallo-hydrolase n=1 Tax=Mucilaginibacter terrae TaxID=1955052 RepID=UPI00364556E6
MKKIILVFAFCSSPILMQAQTAPAHQVSQLKITILSTMLAQEGVGDWGFGALIECDSTKILFDTGGRLHVVRDNAQELDIDLSSVPVVVLSHGHADHTAGWLSLRQEFAVRKKNALATTYIAPHFFEERIFASGRKFSLKSDSAKYIGSGGRIEIIKTWKEISPGVFLTGNNVPRLYPEKNYPSALKRIDASGKISQDTIPEDMSMVIATAKGLILITGCGHSGTVNLVAAVEKHFPGQKIYAAIGGFHLLAATDQQIERTAKALKQAGIQYFMGAHCTGIEPVHQIMQYAGLKRNECIVGSVGATFDPAVGFIAGQLTMGNDKNAYFKK